jgi:sugar phosphate isomerase/epimerase
MEMTRKDFLQTLAGAGAYAALPAAPGTPAPPKAGLRRGVSLYSYQEEFYTRAMTLEDCLSEASSIGASAIEMLPEEMVPDFPNPSDKWVDQWRAWMVKYNLTADTYCQFQDTVLTRGRDLPLDEGVAMLERDLRLARRMGFKNMRLLIGTPLDVVERAIPLAEKYDVWMGCEVHAPATVDCRLVQRWVAIIEKHKTTNFGLVPDFGIFQKRPPRVQRDRQIRDGQLTEKVAKYIEQARDDGKSQEAVAAEVARMGPKPGDTRYVGVVYGTKMQDPKALIPLKPYIRHFHAKFYEMTEEYREYSIPYEEVIPVLVEAGFDASIVSEYEGQRHTQDVVETDSCEQVRRQHVLLRRLLGEA